MKGTEKQIAWANDILAKINPAMDWGIANAPANQKDAIAAIKTKINNADASKIINAFSSFSSTGDSTEDFMTIGRTFRANQKLAAQDDKI